MKMMQLENITKNFGDVMALDGIDLSLDEGQILGFIGPNGAGKTTTLRILMGIIQASSGNASIFGKDAWNDGVELHKRISYVPGDVNLWPNLTDGEVIDLFMRLKRGSSKNLREQLITRFDLDPTKKCRTYSKGNRQKVALIAAFAADSDLYVLDEPTSGLDPLMESVFQDCVLDLKKQGKSVLLSSHILSEVETLCDSVSIIRQGKIIESGTLLELRHLTQTSIEVRTALPLDELLTDARIHDLIKSDGAYSFNVNTSELGSLMTELSRYQISSLKCMPPSLEQLFMSHYSERG